MLTQKDVISITEAQLALDMSCTSEDLRGGVPVIGAHRFPEGRRVYSSDGCMLHCINWRDTLIVAARPEFLPWCRKHLSRQDACWLFEYPTLRAIDRAMQAYGHTLDDIHLYFLPDVVRPNARPAFPVMRYEQADIAVFTGDNRFSEAFCFAPSHPDVLAFAAMDGDSIMGIAGASADGKDLWQIGIDVLPAYRGRGVATQLVALLKDEILRRGKVPFYGTCPSHIVSQKVACGAGFVPAWVELFSRERETEARP